MLANHAPLMAILEPAELKLYKSGSDNPASGDAEVFAQGEGYLQVIDNSALARSSRRRSRPTSSTARISRPG